MNNNMVMYTTDLLVFGIDSRESDNCRSLPKKYFSILLVKRSKEPYKEKWCLPGGYVSNDETSKEAVVRVLKKETGLENVYMQQIGVHDEVNRDPRGRTVSTSYMALVDRTAIKQELMEEACWFDISIEETNDIIMVNLTNGNERINYKVKKIEIDTKTDDMNYEIVMKSDLAFDHDKIIIQGIMNLRHKVNSTDIVFNLMPELFTIGQLKQVYELLLGRELVNSAFRRVMADKIEETGETIRTGGHRPSMICRYKKGE